MLASLRNNAKLRRGSRYFKNDIFRKTSFNKDFQKSGIKNLSHKEKLPLFLSDNKLNEKFRYQFIILMCTLVLVTLYLAYKILF